MKQLRLFREGNSHLATVRSLKRDAQKNVCRGHVGSIF